MQQLIVPFTLYGLVGCPHCVEAESFLRVRNLPFNLVIANDDPIADAGIKDVTGQANYPVLIYKPLKKYVVGFEKEKYAEFADNFYALLSASTPSVFNGGQQPVSQAPVEDKAA
jgi:glutaredoxin